MHENIPPEVASRVAALLACEGWSLIVSLLADSEQTQLRTIRLEPLGPKAQAAAVALAHIETLRDAFRSVTPETYGDPFDVAERPLPAGHGQTVREPEPEPDEYEL